MALDLRAVVAGAPAGTIKMATITAMAPDGTLSVDLGGNRIVSPCPRLDTWVPAVGMGVVVARIAESWVALGPVATTNPATVTAAKTLSFPFDVLPAASGATSPITVSAVSTSSWRERGPGGWMTSDVYQGAYSTQWGYYRGCYFYGSGAFSSAAGRRATSLTIRLSRKGSGGIAGAEYVYLAPHVHPSRPGGAPYFPVAARKYLGPAWNSTATITLPTEWGQGLIDGKYAGIGHLYLGTADYAIFNGVGSDSTSGRLSLGFS